MKPPDVYGVMAEFEDPNELAHELLGYMQHNLDAVTVS